MLICICWNKQQQLSTIMSSDRHTYVEGVPDATGRAIYESLEHHTDGEDGQS